MTSVLKRRETNVEENASEDRGRGWRDVSAGPGIPSVAGNTKNQKKKIRIHPYRVQREHGRPTPWLWTSGRPDCERHFSCFEPPGLWPFVTTAQEANINVWEPGTRRMGGEGPGADRTAQGVARKRVRLFTMAVVAGRGC